MQTFEIGDVEVSGAPNIIYAHHRINEGEKKMGKPRIVAVCKVKIVYLYIFSHLMCLI